MRDVAAALGLEERAAQKRVARGVEKLRRFWSPLLFVDGHAKFFDFTRAIDATAKFNCEPTADWIWYKPASTNTNGPVMFD